MRLAFFSVALVSTISNLCASALTLGSEAPIDDLYDQPEG